MISATTLLLPTIPLPSTYTTIPTLLIILPLSLLLYHAALTTHHYLLHRPIPGPLSSRLSPFPLWRATHHGHEARAIHSLHQTYGPVVLIAPNEVSISTGAALKPIYVDHGGFIKAPCYANFDIDGHASIFSELGKEKRLRRWKAVQGLFSSAAIAKDGEEGIKGAVGGLVEVLEGGKKSGRGRMDVLGPARAFALDAVSGYLFGRRYGGLEELRRKVQTDGEDGVGAQISAGLFVDEFVAVGRFFYLPGWLFALVEALSARFAWNKRKVEASMGKVDMFVALLVGEAAMKIEEEGPESQNSYPARLLKAGISVEETRAQCKDLMFAGTDSTGMNLAMACWYLARDPERYARLRNEVDENTTASPFTLPYLNAVVREALRLSMANPTRMPRVVPSTSSGLFVPTESNASIFIPKGTIVGLQPYTLHHNPSVFPSPHEFMPERWENPTPEMLRDWIPFGLGSRACIARNVATVELTLAVEGITRCGVLEGLRPAEEKVEILEWFNSRVIGEKIELKVRDR